jgi:septation ring formation regulator EzrA
MRAPGGRPLRLLVALLLGLVTGGGSLVGCHRTAATEAGQAGPSPDSVRQSLATLKKQFSNLRQNFSSLRKAVEAIPATLPGYPQLRAHFYAVEEVRGVTDARVTVLSNRLESALRSAKRNELQAVSNDIGKASNDCQKIGALYMKLFHEVMAFQRVADQQKQALDASSAPPAPGKAAPSKSKH